GQETRPSCAPEAAVPEIWECPRCGFPAGQDEHSPPAPPRVEPYKTHLAYVKERRSDADGAAILEEALNRLRQGAQQHTPQLRRPDSRTAELEPGGPAAV